MCPHKILLVVAILIILLVVIISYNYCISNRLCAEKFVSENCKFQHTPADRTILAPIIKVNSKVDDKEVAYAKNDKQEPKINKLVIYHMPGCGHCHKIMKEKNNGITIFEELVKRFANDPSVKIHDFEYGKDTEADKYNAFPVIKLITPAQEFEYHGARSVNDIEQFIKKNKN